MRIAIVRVLYLTWDGAQDPYLETLFWPLLSRLRGFQFDVLQISPAKKDRTNPMKQRFQDQGIRYEHVRIPAGGKSWAAPWAIFQAVQKIRTLTAVENYQGFLFRSNLPAVVVRLLGPMIQEKMLIFDADGFVQDERVEFGAWSSRGTPYRILRSAETWPARPARAVLVRAEKAKSILLERAGPGCSAAKVFVATNGRDENEFLPQDATTHAAPPKIFFAGSFGPQYCPREMIAFYRQVQARVPRTEFEFCTPQPEPARKLFAQSWGSDARIKIHCLWGEDLRRAMRSADLGLSLRRPSFSMQAVSPIKCGEYLLSGVPVLLGRGTGDLDRILAKSFACRFLEDFSDSCLESAADWFVRAVLPRREEYRREARKTGLEHFSLDACLKAHQRAFDFAVASFRESPRGSVRQNPSGVRMAVRTGPSA